MSLRDRVDAAGLRRLYAERRNILEHLRDERGTAVNDELSVMVAYDLQAGSYVELVTGEGPVAEGQRASAKGLAAVLDELGPASLLDAGTGEATLLTNVLDAMTSPPDRVYGFDISLSRLLVARNWARERGHGDIGLFAATLTEVPMLSDSIDTVFTNHALEPNHGRERQIIEELYRVCRRYLVLREPSWELGDDATRARIERHGYVRGIPDVLADMGCDVIEHRLFEADVNAANQSALTIVRKRDADRTGDGPEPLFPFASPLGKGPLVDCGEAFYSDDDALVFPVLSGVPVLLADYGVFSTKYLALRAEDS